MEFAMVGEPASKTCRFRLGERAARPEWEQERSDEMWSCQEVLEVQPEFRADVVLAREGEHCRFRAGAVNDGVLLQRTHSCVPDGAGRLDRIG